VALRARVVRGARTAYLVASVALAIASLIARIVILTASAKLSLAVRAWRFRRAFKKSIGGELPSDLASDLAAMYGNALKEFRKVPNMLKLLTTMSRR